MHQPTAFPPVRFGATGGTWIDVGREADVLIYDRKKPIRVFIFDPNGRMYVFEPDQISAVEVK